MTDNEIILGLKCLADEDEILCINCAFRDINCGFSCKKMVSKTALDLIRRQKAEIERLTTLEEKEDKHCRDVCEPHLHETIKSLEVELKAMCDAAKSCKAECDRLTELATGNVAWVEDNHDLRVELKTTKADAIKEFAERIQKHCTSIELNEYIDSLVKEMTEDTI